MAAASPPPFVLNVSAILAANGCEGESVTRYVFELGNGAVLTGTLPAPAASPGDAPKLTPKEQAVVDCLRRSPDPVRMQSLFRLMNWPLSEDGQARSRNQGFVKDMADRGLIVRQNNMYADSSAKFDADDPVASPADGEDAAKRGEGAAKLGK